MVNKRWWIPGALLLLTAALFFGLAALKAIDHQAGGVWIVIGVLFLIAAARTMRRHRPKE